MNLNIGTFSRELFKLMERSLSDLLSCSVGGDREIIWCKTTFPSEVCESVNIGSGIRIDAYVEGYKIRLDVNFLCIDSRLMFDATIKSDYCLVKDIDCVNKWVKDASNANLARCFQYTHLVGAGTKVDIIELFHVYRYYLESEKIYGGGCRACSGMMDRIVYDSRRFFITSFSADVIEYLDDTFQKLCFNNPLDKRNRFCIWMKGQNHSMTHLSDAMFKTLTSVNRGLEEVNMMIYVHIRQQHHLHYHLVSVIPNINYTGILGNILVSPLDAIVLYTVNASYRRVAKGAWDSKHSIDIPLPVNMVYRNLSRAVKPLYLLLLYMVCHHALPKFIGPPGGSWKPTTRGMLDAAEAVVHLGLVSTSIDAGWPVLSQAAVLNLLPFYYKEWPQWLKSVRLTPSVRDKFK